MNNKAKIGNKALNLLLLKKKGFNVPKFIVIEAPAVNINKKNFLSPSLKKDILKKANSNFSSTTLLAVRSSALQEDQMNKSFAGQYKSFLNVDRDKLINAVSAVWQSGYNQKLTSYSKDYTQQAPAVILQEMIAADYAGIAFSSDPINNENITIISVIKGLADKLAAGKVSGQTFRLDNNTRKLDDQKAIGKNSITLDNLQAIQKLAMAAADFFKAPQDIEWCIKDAKLFLLQSRPITNKNSLPTILDNSNIVESYSGVTTPLTFSFAHSAYSEAYKQLAVILGVNRAVIAKNEPVFNNMISFLHGHIYYYLLNWYRALSLMPGFQFNRKNMELMMGVRKSLPQDFVNSLYKQDFNLLDRLVEFLRIFWVGLKLLFYRLILSWKIRQFYQLVSKSLVHDRETIKKLNHKELISYFNSIQNKLLTNWHAPLLNDFFCMVSFGLTKRLLHKKFQANENQVEAIILKDSRPMKSSEPIKLIRALASIIADKDAIKKSLNNDNWRQALRLIKKDNSVSASFNNYLINFADRTIGELKLESYTLYDDPTELLQAIKSQLFIKPATSNNQENNFKLSLFERFIVNETKNRIKDRENLRFERTRVFGHARMILLEIGIKLKNKKIIDNQRDIFFLELAEALNSKLQNIKKTIKSRKNLYNKWLKLPEFPRRIESHNSLDNIALDEILVSMEKVQGDSIYGIASSPGIVKARVRIIKNPKNAKIKKGEIIVALSTDPGWVTLFSQAAGLLVQYGNLLSHSAIVAREMNLPCIVAINGLVDWVKDGELVIMDGLNGVVKKIKK